MASPPPRRPLGRSGLDVPPLLFGGNVFGWTADRDASFRLLDTLRDRDLLAVDTADMYSSWVPGHVGGESETVIGQWLAARPGAREGALIATKVGMPGSDGQGGLSRARIRQQVEGSLRRLGTDRIDLYQAHQDDPATPLEETLGAFGELVAEGKVRAVGASNYTGARLAEALAVSAAAGLPRYETLQPGYNLVQRQPFEADLLPVIQREGLSAIPFYGLAAGFLTGKYRRPEDLEGRARGGSAGRHLNPRGLAVLETLDAVAAERDATCAQVALAWLAGRPGVAAPIASATSLDQLADLLGFIDLDLTPADTARLDAASA